MYMWFAASFVVVLSSVAVACLPVITVRWVRLCSHWYEYRFLCTD